MRTYRHFLKAWLATFLLLVAYTTSRAADVQVGKPLFELGLIGGGGHLVDYPASNESRFRGVALPYFTYRGKFLRSDEKGLLRGRIIQADDVEVDISLNGSFPVDSDDNSTRSGLPDLDWLGEIGPRLQFTLTRAPAGSAKIDIELPIRAVFSTDIADWNYRGIIVAPEVAYQNENFLNNDIKMKLGFSINFATVELMDYFYNVEPQFATAARPAFLSDSGYLGSKIQFTAFKAFNSRWRGVLGLKVDLHQGATNEGSPLFKDETSFTAGLGLIWSFYQSDARGVE